jgi:Fur family ferric uptake transcriptional regulator
VKGTRNCTLHPATRTALFLLTQGVSGQYNTPIKYQEVAGLLNQSSLRMTPQRQVILEELRKVNTHPSADEIYEMVRKRLPRISLGTVYRNLEILSASGEIQKLEFGCSLKRFDGVAQDHYHIRCLNCDRVIDAPPGSDIWITYELKENTDFKIIGHKLEFIGLCPACLNHSQS